MGHLCHRRKRWPAINRHQKSQKHQQQQQQQTSATWHGNPAMWESVCCIKWEDGKRDKRLASGSEVGSNLRQTEKACGRPCARKAWAWERRRHPQQQQLIIRAFHTWTILAACWPRCNRRMVVVVPPTNRQAVQ